MKEIIRNLILKASEEKDFYLADLANSLMSELASTYNCPSDWRNILEELHEEFKNNNWIINAIYEFSLF